MTNHAMGEEPEPGIPDTRDWTTVLDSGCEECGYRVHDPTRTGERLHSALDRWLAVLGRADVAQRPAPRVWSAMEYGGHCRDLIEVLGDRVAVMLAEEGPTFADFDGEVAVRERGYWRSDPAELADRLVRSTARTRDILDRVGPGDWQRTGRRGDGYEFTIATLCRYIVHDVEHHLVDVHG